MSSIIFVLLFRFFPFLCFLPAFGIFLSSSFEAVSGTFGLVASDFSGAAVFAAYGFEFNYF